MVLESSENSKTIRRKLEHIEIVYAKPVEGPLTTWFEYIFLPHRALPVVDPEKVSTRMNFLKKEIEAPLMITGMTGGAPGTEVLNKSLAEAACRFKIVLGLGSQRAALESRELAYTYSIVRDVCTEIPVVGNIGISEIVRYGPRIVDQLTSIVEVDALAVHLNYFQEVVQPEGLVYISRGLEVLSEVIERSPVPVIVKEVGFGISREFAEDLYSAGIRYIDVAGSGGTNWTLVELYRAMNSGNLVKQYIADGLKSVGIPTAASIAEVRSAAEDFFIIGSGGVRSPYDAVKALRLGADMVGLARPILVAYVKKHLREFLEAFIVGVKSVLASVGATTLHDIEKCPIVVTGPLKDWVNSRRIVYLKDIGQQ
ncbi:MAG: type 2 isopentenyl-diphosphate Delta-isomerase [Sulfolobales archaeon]|nr:type 2 isopentenyl-diphosphate Delta-isomerase [Sulfolobales archaeon]MDW8083299.1 type 2 isopentenyl-diphosphate Delta-isomerase [Sulfolobales archaeon]